MNEVLEEALGLAGIVRASGIGCAGLDLTADTGLSRNGPDT